MKPKPEFRSPAAKPILVAVLVFLGLMLLPVVARIGSTKTMRSWNSTPGALGTSRPLILSIQKTVAYVDLLGGYPSYRILISYGGYAFFHTFDVPSAKPETFLESCNVAWSTNDVRFQMPNGVLLVFPAEAVLKQIGR